MGTWGYKTFENDGAADWLFDLEVATKADFLLKPLRTVLRTKRGADEDDCLEGLASADVLAGARYEPPRNLPPIARSWVKRVALVPTNTDLKLAIEAVVKIGTNSELADSWNAEGKLVAWQKEIKKLSQRLTAALRVPIPVRQIKPKVQRENLAELIIAVATDKTHTRRAELQKKLAKLSNPNRPVGGKLEGKTLNTLTPLHWVASRGMVPEVKLLLARGVDVDGAMPFRPFTAAPIDFAIVENHIEIVALLLEAGADRRKALFSAISEERVEVIKMIIAAGLDINAKIEGDWTAMLWAARQGSPKALKLLLEVGTEVNCADIDGDTPLHNAAAGSHFDGNAKTIQRFAAVVKLLVEGRAKLNVENSEGKTPLDIAEEANAIEVVRLLRKRGARSGKVKRT